MSSESGIKKLLVVIFIFVILFTYLAITSSWKSGTAPGPSALAIYSDGRVVLSLTDRLILLTQDGTLSGEYLFEKLSVYGPVGDIEAISDGRLLIADGGSKDLKICDAELHRCSNFLATTSDRDAKLGQFLNVSVDEIQGTIYVSDIEHHRIVLFGLDGSFQGILVPKTGALSFPNDIVFWGDNEILVANTMKERVDSINMSTGKTVANYPTSSRFVVNNQSKPTRIIPLPNYTWWVVARSNSMKGTSILTFDSAWQATGRLQDDKLIQPSDLALTESGVLVTDKESVGVYLYSQSGQPLGHFGDSRLQEILLEAKDRYHLAKLMKYVSIGALILLMAIALLLERKRKGLEDKKKSKQANMQVAGNLTIDIPQSLHYSIRAFLLVFVLMLPFSFFLTGFDNSFLTSFLSTISAIVLFMYLIARRIPLKIELANGILNVTDYKKVLHRAPLMDVVFSPAAILLKNNYFLLGRDGFLVKDKEKYKQLLTLLQNNKSISEWQFFKHQLWQEPVLFTLVTILLIASVISPTVANFSSEKEEIRKDIEVMFDVMQK